MSKIFTGSLIEVPTQLKPSNNLHLNILKTTSQLHLNWKKSYDKNFMFDIKNAISKDGSVDLNLKCDTSIVDKLKKQLFLNIETVLYSQGENTLHICNIVGIKIVNRDTVILTLNDIYLKELLENKDDIFEPFQKITRVFGSKKWSALKRQCTKSYMNMERQISHGSYRHMWDSMNLRSRHYLVQAHSFKTIANNPKNSNASKLIKSSFNNYQKAVLSQLDEIFINSLKELKYTLEILTLGDKCISLFEKNSFLEKDFSSLSDFLFYCDSAPDIFFQIRRELDRSLSRNSLDAQNVISKLESHLAILTRDGVTQKIKLLDKLNYKINNSNGSESDIIEYTYFMNELISSNRKNNIVFSLQEFQDSKAYAKKDFFESLESLVA